MRGSGSAHSRVFAKEGTLARMKPIREGLTAAACSLVGLSVPPAARATDLDTTLLVYTESGERLNTFESRTKLNKALSRGKHLALGLTIDIMTGASPNGATPADKLQTFTRPSGKGTYEIRPGQTPLDPTFQDNRVAGDITLEVPIGGSSSARMGGYASFEYDYISLGANGSFTRNFDRRNTAVTASVSANQDFLDPQGGTPIPFAPMLPPGPQFRQGPHATKTVVDGMLGVTQVISRRTLTRLNYSISYLDGYLTDPFKMISVIDPVPGPDQGEPLEYRYERRPGSRARQALWWTGKHHFTSDILDLSYRYYRDDWGVQSHTAELRYRWEADERHHFEPQFRFYHQSAADFYVYSLNSGEPLPAWASADYRLGAFDAYTVALNYSAVNTRGHLINLRVGYYLQMGDSSPPSAIGSQRHHDLFPTVGAMIIQVGYGLEW